jgi:hypothetical protein
MLPLPAIQFPNSRHLHALSLLPTLPLRVLGVALTAKTVVRHVCDTVCDIPYAQFQSICANTFFSLSLDVCAGFRSASCTRLSDVRESIGWIVADVEFVYSRRLCFATAILSKHLQSRGITDKESS